MKAVNLFPAGTVRRWETVADFINTHSGEGSREKDARMVISKVKNLKKFEADQKDSLNKQAFSHFEQQHQTRDKGRALEEQPQAMPSERYGIRREQGVAGESSREWQGVARSGRGE